MEKAVDEPLGGKGKQSAFKALGLLDQLLALWIFLAMAIGILLGNFVPSTGPTLQKGQFVGVPVPISEFMRGMGMGNRGVLIMMTAVGLLVMMYPIMCKVRYEELHIILQARKIWVQIGFSILVNWIFAPFLMVVSPRHPKKSPLRLRRAATILTFALQNSWRSHGHFYQTRRIYAKV